MATSDGKRLFQHFRPSSERRLPQLSAKAPMRYKAICFSSRRMRPLVSRSPTMVIAVQACCADASYESKNREVMHENATAQEG